MSDRSWRAAPMATGSADTDEAIWGQFLERRDPALRSILLDRYLGLVYRCAGAMASRLRGAVEFDDLLGAGALGLVQAFDRFDPARGNTFSTFAVRRIQGAILDELRWRDWRPRSARVKGRLLAATTAALQKHTGTPPNAQELAHAMGTDLPTYYRIKEAAEGRTIVPLSEVDDEDIGHRRLAGEAAAERAEPGPLVEMARTETTRELRRAVRPLPLRQRAILALYYDAEMNLKEIGEILGVSESRVSQLRSQAVQSLRHRMVVEPELV